MSIYAILIAVVVIVVLIPLLAIVMYNRMVRLRNQVENALSQIVVQLKRRHELIPNLVETVRGYAAHERATLEAVTQARVQAINASGPAQQAAAENALSGALKGLFAVAENYPDLKANQNFLALQEELSDTESRIGYSRQYYNDAVLAYDNAISTFPANLFAVAFGFQQHPYFEAGPEERGPVRVQF
jgi:LemA protein